MRLWGFRTSLSSKLFMPVILLVTLAACSGTEGTDEPAADAGDSAATDPVQTEVGAPTPASTAAVSSDCSFFEGQTIQMIVPFDPGGGFDVYTRLIAPYLGEELGATAIVENRPGAGGILATNQTWAAEPDGLLLEMMPSAGIISAQLGEGEGVEYQAAEFSWIGRVSGEPDAVIVAADGPVSSIDDLMQATEDDPVRFGSVGPGDIDYMDALVFGEALGIPVEVVTGFAGAPEAVTSMLRGEVEAYGQSLSGALTTIESGDTTALALFGDERSELVPDVPTLSELTEGDAAEEILQAHYALIASGRALAGPPGIPEDRLQCLRDAYETVATDPEFLAEAEEQGRPIDYLTGEEMTEVVNRVAGNPPQEYVDLIRESFSGAG